MLDSLKQLRIDITAFISNFYFLLITVGVIHLFLAVTSYLYNETTAVAYALVIVLLALALSIKYDRG